MKELSMRELDAEDLELVHILREQGLNRRMATVLVFLSGVDEASTHEIERGTDLRQPDVSLATGFLRDRGWVVDREVRYDGNGRAHKVYRLATSLPDVARYLEAQKVKELAEVQESLEELKWLGQWVRRRS